MANSYLPLETRFWREVHPEPNTGCWLWSGTQTKSGYGMIRNKNKALMAHRVSYEFHCGTIGDGLEIDHLCRVRGCVNPEHLEPVTRLENVRRSRAGYYKRTPQNNCQKAKTHCPQGHPYSGDNLWVSKTGTRQCKTCHREREAIRSRLKRSAGRMSVVYT